MEAVLPPALPLLTATGIVALASALQAATGMGMALVAVPLLALVDPSLVPGPALCAVLVLSAAVAWQQRRAINPWVLRTALLGLAVGCAIGAGVLALLIGYDLSHLFAILILAAVAVTMSGVRIPIGPISLTLGGTAAGIVGTMSGAHGPPIALVLQHAPHDERRATLCAFFAVACVLSLLALGLGGLLQPAQLGLGVALLPGVAIGVCAGPWLGRHIDQQRGRIAVLAISTLSALALLLH